jgi:hypothetical protein
MKYEFHVSDLYWLDFFSGQEIGSVIQDKLQLENANFQRIVKRKKIYKKGANCRRYKTILQ